MAAFVHPDARCDAQQLGEGTRVWGNTHILAGAKIGARCNIGEQVFIENKVVVGDDCTIKNGNALWDLVTLEDGVFVGPYCVFTNEPRPRSFIKRGVLAFLPTHIGRGATIGANAVIVCGLRIGEFAMIGAGAVVTKDVAPHALVYGNPAKFVGRICFCGADLNDVDFCAACRLPLTENSVETAQRLHTLSQ
jgi:UDP-2-acetamido-3-amino-2,3-dideoxy-glucuronate N-acetyltransferase